MIVDSQRTDEGIPMKFKCTPRSVSRWTSGRRLAGSVNRKASDGRDRRSSSSNDDHDDQMEESRGPRKTKERKKGGKSGEKKQKREKKDTAAAAVVVFDDTSPLISGSACLSPQLSRPHGSRHSVFPSKFQLDA